jgi:hypothetical protein
MKRLRYNAEQTVRLDFPNEWYVKSITGVTLTILNDAGTELLADDAATLYTATTLDGAADRYASSIVLADGSDALNIGDPILIAGVAKDEYRLVKGYDASVFTAELTLILDADHDDGDAVYGLFATISVDLTDTDTFYKGLPVTLLWTPDAGGRPITERAEITGAGTDVATLRKKFQHYCPRAYDAFISPVERFDVMLEIAENSIDRKLRREGLSYDRIMDQDDVSELLMSKLASLWANQGDETLADERKTWGNEFSNNLSEILSINVIADDDQDTIVDSNENTSHEPIFDRSW